VRKYLRYYRIVFGIEPPYHILLDGNFLHSMLIQKIDVRERLEHLLQKETIKLFVTRSVIKELTSAGAKTAPALKYALKFCGILEDCSQSSGGKEDELISTNLETFISSFAFLDFSLILRRKFKYKKIFRRHTG
jgi:rRNA-processing protein FCF1